MCPFILHINDLPDNLAHKFNADVCKLIVELETDRDHDDMQSDINRIVR